MVKAGAIRQVPTKMRSASVLRDKSGVQCGLEVQGGVLRSGTVGSSDGSGKASGIGENGDSQEGWGKQGQTHRVWDTESEKGRGSQPGAEFRVSNSPRNTMKV